eukprot:1823787-Alexandrium_andersonii.AAC.1
MLAGPGYSAAAVTTAGLTALAAGRVARQPQTARMYQGSTMGTSCIDSVCRPFMFAWLVDRPATGLPIRLRQSPRADEGV